MRQLILLFLVVFSLNGMALAQVQEKDQDTFNHDLWQQVLNEHVSDGTVNYRALQKNPAILNDYLRSISDLPLKSYLRWSQNEKIAFWLNVYNAATVKLILDHYPLKKGLSWKALKYPENSIQQIPNVWNRDVLKVFGKLMSLNAIEHETIRKDFAEPRIHFALVCASIGCPVIRDEAYVGSRLDGQLDDQTKTFLSDRTKNDLIPRDGKIGISPIFKWFSVDFEKSHGSVLAFLSQYEPAVKSGSPKISYLPYDWSLNEA